MGHGLFPHARAAKHFIRIELMTKSQRFFIVFLSVLACGLLGTVFYYGAQNYEFWAKQPLGPGLSNVTPWILPATWTASPTNSGSLPRVARPVSTLIVAPSTNTPSPITRCGGPPVMNLLAVGSDYRGDGYLYGLGDVIRIVRVDFITPKVTVLEFPRDLWVQIPDIADNLKGQDHEKLNQAYLYGNKGFGYTDDPAQGPGLLARTLALNFGVKLDHYVAVNMHTFVNIVDAVGGIDVNLPDGLDGREGKDQSARLVFPKGEQHLDGEQALTIARMRNEGVFQRADNQNLILCALRQKLANPDVIQHFPDLISSFKNSIQTDLTPEQIGQLACLGPQIPAGNIIFASFPQELFTGTRVYDPVFGKRVFIWDVDFSVLRSYVAQFQAGSWPVPFFGQTTQNQDAPIKCQ